MAPIETPKLTLNCWMTPPRLVARLSCAAGTSA